MSGAAESGGGLKKAAKSLMHALATIAVGPELLSFAVRARLFGQDRALESSSHLLSLAPGLTGQYLRRAFLSRVLKGGCGRGSVIEFGTVFSRVGATVGENVYIGPRCHVGLASLGRDVLLAAGVHVPSGGRAHGTDDVAIPIREQPGDYQEVRIGDGSWVGSAAVVMADVGQHCVIGAGAVVTRPVSDYSVAVGVPARVVKVRRDGRGTTDGDGSRVTTSSGTS